MVEEIQYPVGFHVTIAKTPIYIAWHALIPVMAIVFLIFAGTGAIMPRSLILSTAAALVVIVAVIGHELVHTYVAIALGLPVFWIKVGAPGAAAYIVAQNSPTTWRYVTAIISAPILDLVIGLLLLATAYTTQGLLHDLSLLAAVIYLLSATANLLPLWPIDLGTAILHATFLATRSHTIAFFVSASVGFLMVCFISCVLWFLFLPTLFLIGKITLIGVIVLVAVFWIYLLKKEAYSLL